MIVQDTIEKYINYAQELIHRIKARQAILGTKLDLYETFSEVYSMTIDAQSVARLRLVFTPDNPSNMYAEFGAAVYISNRFTIEDVYADPSYANSTNKAWIIAVANTSGWETLDVNMSASVISPSPGTLTGAWI